MSDACPVCESRRFSRPRLRAPGAVARCVSCGLLVTVPRRSDTELAELYDEGYFEDWLGGGSDTAALDGHRRRAEFVTSLRRPGRLLDVGAAIGHFVAALRELGWEVEAVEPDERAWGLARERFGLPPAAPAIFGIAGDRVFDAVCFWHSLEHHADPESALLRAGELVTPGGIVLVECPNAASLDRFAAGRDWSGWHLPYHTVHYSPRTLTEAFGRAGLHVSSIRTSIWQPLAAAGRELRGLVSRGGDAGVPSAPFLLRQKPRFVIGSVARLAAGRDMLVIGERI